MNNEIQIVATGPKWIGKGIRTTYSVIKDIIKSTKCSLLITVSYLSNDDILKDIEDSLKRGINIVMYINDPENNAYHLNGYLNILEKKYANLIIYRIYDDFFHAKIIVSDRKKVLIGSANLTKNGMGSNYELGVVINNSEIAFEIEDIVRRFK